MKKLSLQREGYDPGVVSDPLFFFDCDKGGYRTLDEKTFRNLSEMRLRL